MAKANLNELISPVTDTKFGGYYLNIERTMIELKVSRLAAHEIQNQMRDQLENISGSFSRVAQKPYVLKSLENAIKNVIEKNHFESSFKSPVSLKKDEFIIILDLDETLFSQWYSHGEVYSDYVLNTRDTVPATVDKSGNSINRPEMLYSPLAVKFRPNTFRFLDEVANIKGFKGFVLFTAKEDRAAWDIIRQWKNDRPKDFKNVLGIFTRNYLRFDESLKKPSKDLRLFSLELSNILLIDDNEGRVLQKDLNYRVPKFNADLLFDNLLTSQEKTIVEKSNEYLFDYITSEIKNCALQKDITLCFRTRLGELSLVDSQKELEIVRYLEWLNKNHQLTFSYENIIELEVFEPHFYISMTRFLLEDFPLFIDGILVE